MNYKLPLLLLMTLCLVFSCETTSDETGQGDSNNTDTSDYDGALIVKDAGHMAECNDDTEGWLYYLIDDAEFQYCDGSDYTAIDLSGEDGNDGTDGVITDFTNVTAKVKRTTNEALADATFTAISYPTEDIDTGDMFAAGSPQRFTITEDGVYFTTCSIQYESNATGSRNISLRVDGTDFISGTTVDASAAGVTALNGQAMYEFTAGQYIECMGFQSTGGSLDIQFSEFQIFKVSE